MIFCDLFIQKEAFYSLNQDSPEPYPGFLPLVWVCTPSLGWIRSRRGRRNLDSWILSSSQPMIRFISLYTLHSTLYNLHSTLYTLHSTLYTLHIKVYTLQCSLYPLPSTLYTLQSTIHTLHSTPYTLHSTLYTLHSTLYTL